MVKLRGAGHPRGASFILTVTLLILLTLILNDTEGSPEVSPPGRKLGLEAVPRALWAEATARGIRVGQAGAGIELVMFTDFECPGSRNVAAAVAAARREYGGRLSVLYRHYPLRMHRPRAYEEARMAECAALVGRFTDLEPILYQRTLENRVLNIREIAMRAGIEDERFLACASEGSEIQAVSEDIELMRKIGTRRAPTILINGHLLSGSPDVQQLFAIIEDLSERRSPGRY